MKIITLDDVINRGRATECPKGGFISYRYLLASDGMGFGLCKTMIPRGDWQHWHYERHLEACMCISGIGCLRNLATGEIHDIRPDTTYVLNNHDDHEFKAITDVVLISVFNPPLRGDEVHNEDGSYE